MKDADIGEYCQAYKTLLINSEEDISQWTDEELIIIDGPVNHLIIKKFELGLPVKVKFGYQWKLINPPIILHIDTFYKRTDIEPLEMPQKLSGVILDPDL